MKRFLSAIGLAAALVFTAGIALAADKGGIPLFSSETVAASWSGCHLSASVGVTSVGIDELPIGADGFNGGAGVGCDVQAGNLVFGAFGDYGFHRLNLGAGLPDLDVDAWTVGARVGALLNADTLAYGLAGYTWADASVKGVGSEDIEGWVVGGGLETRLADQWGARLEYRYHSFEAVGDDTMTVDPDAHTVRVGILYRFSVPGVIQ